MSNPPDADSQDLTRKILENKKLKREIEQLAFEAEKRGFTSAAGEANFERTKREADLAELRRLERKDLRETERAGLEKDKLNQELAKLKLDLKLLEEDSTPRWATRLRWSRIIGPFGSFFTGILALVVSSLSFYVTYHLSDAQTEKLKQDRILEQDKFFGDILEKATAPDAPIQRRAPFIAALDAFWNKRQSPTLASALLSMIVHDPDPEIRQACADEIDRAWVTAEQNERLDVNKVLFGSRGDGNEEERIGQVQATWTLLNDQGSPDNDPRKATLSRIIARAGPHLEYTNFSSFIVKGLVFLENASFKGADLHGAYATEWILNKADFSQCDLKLARFRNCALDGTLFKEAILIGASFKESDLENADFTNAKLDALKSESFLARANILNVHGLDRAYTEEAFNQGAVAMSRDNFNLWKKAGMNLPDIAKRPKWRQAGFALDSNGNPVNN